MSNTTINTDDILLTYKAIHSIRNSLNTILGYSQILNDIDSMSDDEKKMQISIENAITNINSHISKKHENLPQDIIENTNHIPKSNSNFQSPKILIIDDNTDNLLLFKDILSPFNYEINITNNGKEALEIINNFHPELILLDVIMPDMDGFEVLQELKNNKATNDIPVIFLTANDSMDDIVSGFEAGVVDYIAKPFHPRELIARVDTHLKKANLLSSIKRLMEHSFHELYTPLTVITSAMQMQELEYEKTNYTEMTLAASKTLQNIYDELYYSMNYQASLKSKTIFNLSRLLSDRISYFNLVAKSRSLIFKTNLPEQVLINFNQEDMERIIDNLISNALKYTQENQEITISIDLIHGMYILNICNPSSKNIDTQKIFQKYYRHEEEVFGLGLGLELVQSICKKNSVEVRALKKDKLFCIEMEIAAII